MKFDRSKQLLERACKVIPGGISSNVRANWAPHPMFYDRGEGSHVWDADGNEFIDYVLGRGPLFYGHSPKMVIDAIKKQLDRGLMYAGQAEIEVDVAEKICELVPCAEQVRFGSSGSESVHAALRLARAATGRKKILRFEGHYHGWFDNIAWNFAPPLNEAGPRERPNLLPTTKGQLLEESAGLVVLPWNDLALVEQLFADEGDNIAGVITEPIMCNWGAIMPRPGFLEGLRKVCDHYGVVLIFDEVITGFREALGGAQEHFSVTPDLATFAKAMGGSVCVSAVAGKEKFMHLFGELKTVHAGTYNANPVSMAGAMAALDALSENDGALLKSTFEIGGSLMAGIKELAEKSSFSIAVRGLPPTFHVSFLPEGAEEVVDYRTATQTDTNLTRQLWIELQERGVRVTPDGLWFVSTAHTAQDVEQTLAAVADALAAMEKTVS